MGKAAAAEAYYNRGLRYYAGHGVKQDYAEALKWLRLAAEQGYVEAQTFLGVMYANGQGVGQDYAEAARWYRLAAESIDSRLSAVENKLRNAGMLSFSEKWCDCSYMDKCRCY